jgi:hypothetical protein
MSTLVVTRATRLDSRGLLLKTAVVVPDVIISSLIGLVIIAALPPAVGFGVTAASVAVAAVLATGRGEITAVRILHGARRPTPTESMRLSVSWRIVADRVDTTGVLLRIVKHGPPVATAGRRHILLTHGIVDAHRVGRITDGEAAALITHGIGRLRQGHTRFDLMIMFWTAPWDSIAGLVAGIGRQLSWIPLAKFAWQVRFGAGTAAVVLEAQAGRIQSASIVAVFITLTYLMPVWGRRWEQHLTEHADRFAAYSGFAEDLQRCLRRPSAPPDLLDRIDRLAHTIDAREVRL